MTHHSSDEPAPKIIEVPIDAETLDALREAAEEAAGMLGLYAAALDPAEIVRAVDDFVYSLQKERGAEASAKPELQDPESEESESAAAVLGSLWGQQLVREFGWEWANVTFADYDDAHVVGVFSPDRSLAIYPLLFVFACLENGADVTIQLAFELLKDRSRIPELPPGGYENVMDHVHRIVPHG